MSSVYTYLVWNASDIYKCFIILYKSSVFQYTPCFFTHFEFNTLPSFFYKKLYQRNLNPSFYSHIIFSFCYFLLWSFLMFSTDVLFFYLLLSFVLFCHLPSYLLFPPTIIFSFSFETTTTTCSYLYNNSPCEPLWSFHYTNTMILYLIYQKEK